MKPPNFKGKFQGTHLIKPGWPCYIQVKPCGAVPPISLSKNSSQNRLWEFIIGHMMKAMHPILHPTAFRQKQFVTLAILWVEKCWFKVRTSAIAYSQMARSIFEYDHDHFSSNTR